MKTKFTAIYEKRGKWYIGYVEEIPGVNTQGRTLKEVRRNLKEAIKLILEANKKLGQKIDEVEKRLREPISINIAP